MDLTLTPTARSLLLYHAQAQRNMVLFRQENDGRLFVSIRADNAGQLTDAGLLKCMLNTLNLRDLAGTYHKNMTSFLTRELLDIPQHDTASSTLGFLLRELYSAGMITDVELIRIDHSMVLVQNDTGKIFAFFRQDGSDVKLNLLSVPPVSGATVLHNDLVVSDQIMRVTATTEVSHFSIFDFKLEAFSLLSDRYLAKLSRLFADGGAADITAVSLLGTGKISSMVAIPNYGRVSAEDALKAIMNPPSLAIQYRAIFTSLVAKFVEPIENRREIVFQTDKDIYVSFGEDAADVTNGFYMPANAAMGFTLGSNISICIRAVADDANVFIMQMGV